MTDPVTPPPDAVDGVEAGPTEADPPATEPDVDPTDDAGTPVVDDPSTMRNGRR